MIFDVTQQKAVFIRLVKVMTQALSVIKLRFLKTAILIPNPARSNLLNKPMSVCIAHNVPIVRRVSNHQQRLHICVRQWSFTVRCHNYDFSRLRQVLSQRGDRFFWDLGVFGVHNEPTLCCCLVFFKF